MGLSVDPSQLSSQAATMAARTEVLRACYGGTETMREQSQTFLPQYDKESDARYQARLASTFALNKLREAVDAASAKPFASMVRVTNNTDPNLDLWIEDIDLQGTHLHILGHRFFNEAMLIGQCHILVDHPDTTIFQNLGEQIAANARPYWKLIRDDDIVAIYSDFNGGETQVRHVRIKSSRVEIGDDYKETVFNQIYVIDKPDPNSDGTVTLYEQAATSSGGDWNQVSQTAYTAPSITLVSLYCGDREQEYVTKPVFMDLAYKQIEHWQSSSDQRSILSAARFPMLACSGVQLDESDEQNFVIGPWKVLYSPDPQGRWYYVEPKGSAIDSGLKDLQMLEFQMDMMALNPVVGTHRQYVPQDERDIQETRVHSVVHDLAIACEKSLKRAIMFTGMWANKDYTQVDVELNTEFTNTADMVGELTLLASIWEKKGLSREAFLNEVKERKLLGADFDIDNEIKFWTAVDAVMTSAQGASATTSNNATVASPAPTQPVDPTKAAPAPTKTTQQQPKQPVAVE